jgi:hypothetical protein
VIEEYLCGDNCPPKPEVKQLLQNLSSGKTELVEEPVPRTKNGHVLVQTSVSLISAGTERILVEFGKAGYIAKAKSQPDKVRQASWWLKDQYIGGSPACLHSSLAVILSRSLCLFIGITLFPFVYIECLLPSLSK